MVYLAYLCHCGSDGFEWWLIVLKTQVADVMQASRCRWLCSHVYILRIRCVIDMPYATQTQCTLKCKKQRIGIEYGYTVWQLWRLEKRLLLQLILIQAYILFHFLRGDTETKSFGDVFLGAWHWHNELLYINTAF